MHSSPAAERTKQILHLIGFPMSLGAGKRGMDTAPSALRITGLRKRLEALGYVVKDEGDILITSQEIQHEGNPRLKYLDEILRVSHKEAMMVQAVLDVGDFPLILGGDHSMSIGTLAGVGLHCKERDKKLGVVWVDAHPDMNTPESSPSGNIHGMPLAVALGEGARELTTLCGDFQKVQPENVIIVGARDIDTGEAALIKRLGVRTYTMYDVDKMGMVRIAEEVVSTMRKQGIDHLHVSFDVDSVDPSVAPGVGTPVPGGLSYREAHFLMEGLAESGMVASMDVAEVNPILDERNRTAEFAAEIVSSCLGKRIM
jgi:arginase